MQKIIIDEKKLIPFKSGLEAELFLYNYNNEILIVKKYPDNANMTDIINNALILNSVNIENITTPKYIGIINNKETSIIMDYKENYLESHIIKNILSLGERIDILNKLYKILEQFYENNIIYLDLNPKNILIKDNELCLCDTLNLKKSNIFDKSRFNMFAIYFLNNEIEYTNNLRNDIIPYLEIAVENFFNKKINLDLIGVTDNEETIDIAYKLLSGDIVEENILTYLDFDNIKTK